MLSKAASAPAKKRSTPNIRQHRRNQSLFFGVPLSSFSDAHILAVRAGNAATKTPRTMLRLHIIISIALSIKLVRERCFQEFHLYTPIDSRLLIHTCRFFPLRQLICGLRPPDIQCGQEKDTHQQVGNETSNDHNRERPLRIRADSVRKGGRQ